MGAPSCEATTQQGNQRYTRKCTDSASKARFDLIDNAMAKMPASHMLLIRSHMCLAVQRTRILLCKHSGKRQSNPHHSPGVHVTWYAEAIKQQQIFIRQRPIRQTAFLTSFQGSEGTQVQGV